MSLQGIAQITAGSNPTVGDITVTSSIFLGDDVCAKYGNILTAPNVQVAYDTADANANMLKFDLPAAGAVDVPVVTFGIGIKGVDLALHEGETEPQISVWSADRGRNMTVGQESGSVRLGITGPGIRVNTTDRLVFQSGTDQFFFQPAFNEASIRAIYRTTSTTGNAGFELGLPNASVFFMRLMNSFEECIYATSSFSGRQYLFIDTNQRDRDHDIPVMNEPTIVISGILNPNTESGQTVSLTRLGLRCGQVDNADYSSSIFALLDDDTVVSDFTVSAINAFTTAGAGANPDGASLLLRAGNGNVNDTVAASGGNVVIVPGANDAGGNGTDGLLIIRNVDEGANLDVQISHDATDGHFDTGSGDHKIDAAGTNIASAEVTAGFVINSKRHQRAQGADVVAANNLTLGTDGDSFEITGAIQINAITTTDWQIGSEIDLIFASNPVLKHNTAGGAGTAVMILAGSGDFGPAAGNMITFKLQDLGGVIAWREKSRTVT